MLSNEEIKQILVDQNKSVLKKAPGIEREALQKFAEKQKLPHVIVITGLRRVGKSTLLRQIIQKYYRDNNFYYVNFEDERLFNFDARKFNDIYEALVELYGEQQTFFIDEIQNVQNFETFVRRFYEMGFKFIITGSNANLLSKEIGSKLTGRYINIPIKPFSFNEYLKLRNYTITGETFYRTEYRAALKKHFDNYLSLGGMPEYLLYEDNEILTRTYEDIVIKDIAVRYKIDNLYGMRELYMYLITNFANRFSFTKLKNIIQLGSVNTVKKYISYLEETFFISLIGKYDTSLKKQIANDKKIYVIDNGFINHISTKSNKDKGWLLENLLYNKLSSIGNIYYFNKKNECDFIVQQNKKITMAVQVCWEINNNNRPREINGLISALKDFKLKDGLIITSDQEDQIQIDDYKITIQPAWRWLLER